MHKKRIFLASVIVAISLPAIVAALVQHRSNTFLFHNVEVLMDTELAPGEREYCIHTGDPNDHCCYHYDGKNYNIEQSLNKDSQ